VCIRIGWSPYEEWESSRWASESRIFDFPDWRQHASRLFATVWSACREAFPAQIRSGVSDLRTSNGSRSTPRRYPEAETRALKGHSIHRRRRSYRSTCESDGLPASYRVFFRGSGPGHGDLFTWTIPPAGFTIDSHDTSLALLRSLECYHLTFITARRVVFV